MDDSVISLLIVEDDLDFQYLIQKTIEKRPAAARPPAAETAEQALALTEKEKPDLDLMDLRLKRIQWIRELKRARAILAGQRQQSSDFHFV